MDHRPEGRTTQSQNNHGRWSDSVTNRRHENYDLSHRPRDSYAGGVQGGRYANDGGHHRYHRKEPGPFYSRADQTSRESVVFNREAHRQRVENQGPEDVRKKWEQAWTNHTLAASMRDHQGTKRLAGPQHPPRDDRQEHHDSWLKSIVSFSSPVECVLDDQLLDVRRVKATAKAETVEMEQVWRERGNCDYRVHSYNRYDALKSPGGDWGDASGCAWGADESWQLGTLASSPKPRRKDSPKGATHNGRGVREQLMERMEMNERRGTEQASYRRGEDAQEDNGLKTGGLHEEGVADAR